MGTGRLAIDYTPAPGHAPGLGRYTRELVRALVRIEPAREITLLEIGRAATPMEGAPLGLVGDDVCWRPRRRRLRLPRRLLDRLAAVGDPLGRHALRGSNLLHRTSLELFGLRERRGSMRIPHTIAVAEFPAPGSIEDQLLGQRCRAAAGVITFSHDAATRVQGLFDVDPARITQVPVGCDHWSRTPDWNSPTRPSRDILVLGAVRSSRRPLEALQAFEHLRAGGTAARLLWVGRPGDASEAFRRALGRSPVRSDVRWIEEPREQAMAGCVAGASVLLHLADDEATPVTPLEALRAGLPVVANQLPAFVEALGPHGLWAPDHDAPSTADRLAQALELSRDGSLREDRVQTASRFSWRKSAEAHLRVWEPMLR